jgi:hypothetical protein
MEEFIAADVVEVHYADWERSLTIGARAILGFIDDTSLLAG